MHFSLLWHFDPISGRGLSLRGFEVTLIGHTILGRTPLDECSLSLAQNVFNTSDILNLYCDKWWVLLNHGNTQDHTNIQEPRF